jgi:hypothetical protein
LGASSLMRSDMVSLRLVGLTCKVSAPVAAGDWARTWSSMDRHKSLAERRAEGRYLI